MTTTMIANLKHAARNGGASIGGGDFTPAECREAAAVLESASELLAALKSVLPLLEASYLDHDGTDNGDVVFSGLEAARAAIAKAKGE
jgi:hypothetical protein